MSETTTFALKVHTLGGKDRTFDVSNDTTILSLKEMIQDVEGIDPEHQVLICKGKVLEDGRTMTDYDIDDNTEVSIANALNDGIRINVLVKGGESLNIRIADEMTVDGLKKKLVEEGRLDGVEGIDGVDSFSIRLAVQNGELDDGDAVLTEVGVKKGDLIVLTKKE